MGIIFRVNVSINEVVDISIMILRLYNLIENGSNTSNAIEVLRMRQSYSYALTWHGNSNAVIAANARNMSLFPANEGKK